MKKAMLRSISASAAVLFAASLLASSALADMTAFINVNVISMTDDQVDSGQTVLIDKGRVIVIGPVDTTPLPKDIRIVDGTDRYLMPGLAEMHAHLPDAASDELDRVMSLFAANGVTTIRGMLGRPSHLRLRDALLRNEEFGPRLITSGPSLNGNSVSSADAGARLVRSQFEPKSKPGGSSPNGSSRLRRRAPR